MIAKLMIPFSSSTTLSSKIDYSIKKMNEGKAQFMFDNSFLNDVNELYPEMLKIGSLNDNVSNKFNEVVISLPPGEKIDDEKFMEIAQEYMERMGYGDSCYNVWRHLDTDQEHLHILFTTIDYSGEWIDDRLSWRRSQKLSRELEQKYGLEQTKYDKFQSRSLSEVKSREYYFDNALKKGLKAYNSKEELKSLLPEETMEILKANKLNNDSISALLGEELYEKVGDVLMKHNFFNPLYKDELLKILDDIYAASISKEDFFDKIENAGLYVRMVSNKGVHGYVYGIPDVNVYFKDKQLPMTYRYENISKFGRRDPIHLLETEQKNRIYNKAFIALSKSENFEQYKDELKKLHVTLLEFKNESGVLYGLKFVLDGIENPIEFKASEVSRKLTYQKLNDYFSGNEKSLQILIKQDPTFVTELQMAENIYDGTVFHNMERGRGEEESFLSNKKKKKKKGNDIQKSI